MSKLKFEEAQPKAETAVETPVVEAPKLELKP